MRELILDACGTIYPQTLDDKPIRAISNNGDLRQVNSSSYVRCWYCLKAFRLNYFLW